MMGGQVTAPVKGPRCARVVNDRLRRPLTGATLRSGSMPERVSLRQVGWRSRVEGSGSIPDPSSHFRAVKRSGSDLELVGELAVSLDGPVTRSAHPGSGRPWAAYGRAWASRDAFPGLRRRLQLAAPTGCPVPLLRVTERSCAGSTQGLVSSVRLRSRADRLLLRSTPDHSTPYVVDRLSSRLTSRKVELLTTARHPGLSRNSPSR